MRAAILNPGPSLLHTWKGRTDKHGLLIGVNRVALNYPVDVWACGDYPLVQEIQDSVFGCPTLLSAQNSIDQLNTVERPWRGKTIAFESLYSWLHPAENKISWTFTTSLCAIAYAASVCEHIDIYGADWKGVKDYDGVEAGMNRSEERWKTEAGIYNALVKHLETKNISVTRHLHGE